MEKIDYLEKIGQKEDHRKELIENLKKNHTVDYLCRNNQIPASCIEEYPYQIRQWVKDIAPCQGCKGLSFCKQKMKGYYHDLFYEDILESRLVPCRFKKAYDKKRSHVSQYLVNDLPRGMETVFFENINAERESGEYVKVLGKAMQYCNENKGLFIYGSLGSGKTYLSACAANDHARSGEKTAFIHYPTFTQRVLSSLYENGYQAEVNRLMYVPFLVIDDIGAESVTEFNRDQILLPILNARFENRRTTWFTSNYDLKTLRKHFQFTNKGKDEEVKADRIVERIACMAEEICLVGKDRRISCSAQGNR